MLENAIIQYMNHSLINEPFYFYFMDYMAQFMYFLEHMMRTSNNLFCESIDILEANISLKLIANVAAKAYTVIDN